MNWNRLFNTELGKNFISIMLGLGLATLFKKSCENDNCRIYKAPSLAKLENKPYKFNNNCYNYNFDASSCNKNKRIVDFQ
jgi:hypothetical protein